MKTVVFHLQAKTCKKDISKLKEEILSYNIRIEEKELSEVKEEKDGILAITDQFSDVDYAKEHNIAVIFYEHRERTAVCPVWTWSCRDLKS